MIEDPEYAVYGTVRCVGSYWLCVAERLEHLTSVGCAWACMEVGALCLCLYRSRGEVGHGTFVWFLGFFELCGSHYWFGSDVNAFRVSQVTGGVNEWGMVGC